MFCFQGASSGLFLLLLPGKPFLGRDIKGCSSRTARGDPEQEPVGCYLHLLPPLLCLVHSFKGLRHTVLGTGKPQIYTSSYRFTLTLLIDVVMFPDWKLGRTPVL